MKLPIAGIASFLIATLISACGGGGSESTGSLAITPPVFQITDTTVGTGLVAAAGNTVNIQYTGWAYDPTASNLRGSFFGSTASNGLPTVFVLGAGKVISGLDQGIAGMRVGGTRTIVVPASLDTGGTYIATPANESLVFVVQLLSVD